MGVLFSTKPNVLKFTMRFFNHTNKSPGMIRGFVNALRVLLVFQDADKTKLTEPLSRYVCSHIQQQQQRIMFVMFVTFVSVTACLPLPKTYEKKPRRLQPGLCVFASNNIKPDYNRTGLRFYSTYNNTAWWLRLSFSAAVHKSDQIKSL